MKSYSKHSELLTSGEFGEGYVIILYVCCFLKLSLGKVRQEYIVLFL